MVQTVRIVTDGACDLLPEVAEHFGIEVVPLFVHFGTDVYLDRELIAEEF